MNPYFEDSWVTIYNGDVRDVLPTLEAESVQCCVTSPPYFGLRDYGTGVWLDGNPDMPDCTHENTRGAQGATGERADRTHTQKLIFTHRCGKCGAIRLDKQIGLEPTPEAFIETMTGVFAEVRRVLRADGTLFLDIGDSYFNDTKWGGKSGGKNSTSLAGGYQGQRVRRGRALREDACDTFGITPEDFPVDDCLCGSLCGACRAGYRLGKSRSVRQPAPTQVPLPSDSSRESMGPLRDRPPTSDSAHQEDHSEVANRDPAQTEDHADEPPLGVLESTTLESSPQPSLSCSPASILAAECQLCSRSLLDSVQASARRLDGLQEIEPRTARSASPFGEPGRRILCTAECCSKFSALNNRRNIEPKSYQLKPKDLIGIPWMLAFALRADGWYLRQEIIWHKLNPMPESVKDRPTRSHEQIFLLSKSAEYFYDWEAIQEPASTDTHARYARGRSDSHKWADGGPGNQSIAKSFKHMASRAPGVNPKCAEPGSGIKMNSSFSSAVKDVVEFRNKRSVWPISTKPFPEAHFATFPEALIEPCIKAGSPGGGGNPRSFWWCWNNRARSQAPRLPLHLDRVERGVR